jgi:hypothetical protein
MEIQKTRGRKDGKNIVQIIDINAVVNDFLKFYFSNLKNSQLYITSKVISKFSEFRFNNKSYKENEIIELINSISNFKFSNFKYEHLDCGSRRIDIAVSANFIENDITRNYIQTFLLCHKDDTWFIKNSIIMVI